MERFSPGTAETLTLADAVGRFARSEIRARVASPPFDNSAMDGYALTLADGGETGGECRVTGEQAAGRDQGLSLGEGEAIRIFTGAALPGGTEAVIMQEDVRRLGDKIRVVEPVETGENIRRAGADLCVGQIIVREGDPVNPQRIGMLASQGLETLAVGRPPAVAVLTTGDELVPPGERQLAAGEIYNSNGVMLAGLLHRSGVRRVRRFHAGDSEEALKEALGTALEDSDLLIVAGGVSVGEHDLVKEALGALGVTTDFWRVRVKPGKPFLFGHRDPDAAGGGFRGVFGLPGNPVSAFVTYVLFVEPAIRKWMGAREGLWGPAFTRCVVSGEVRNAGDRPHYVRGRLETGGAGEPGRASSGSGAAGQAWFHPLGVQQSHALFGLSEAGALLRVGAGEELREGDGGIAIAIG